MPDDTTPAKVRLLASELARLEKQAKAVLPTVPSNEFQAAMFVGIQRVLDLLRDGFTVDV